MFASAAVEPTDEDRKRLNDFMIEAVHNTSIHFGYPYLNTATIAGVLRMAVAKLADFYGVEVPDGRKRKDRKPWWAGSFL